MPQFIECRHPKLPGRTVLMATPRNGWKPVTKTSQQPKPGKGRSAKGAAIVSPEQE